MASETTIEQLIEYYVNLLIIQYNLPKAQATIALLAEALMAEGVYFDVQNAYNIIPTSASAWDQPNEDWDSGGTWDSTSGVAIGTQLDVLGKYVGVNRYYSAIDLEDYFALVSYSEATSLPTSPPAFGCSTYATFGNFDYNGTLLYADVITSQNALSDSDFYTLILFMILCNNMNYSAGAIDRALFQIFGTMIRAESNYNMNMTFFLSNPVSTLINTIIFKRLLPVPEGVGFGIVSGITGLMFALTSYSEYAAGVSSPFAYGFSTYSNYATLVGQTLTYSQIS